MNKMMHGYKDEKELGQAMLKFEIDQAIKQLRPAPPNIALDRYMDSVDQLSELCQLCLKHLPKIGGKSSRQLADKLGLRDRRSAGNALRNLEKKGLAKVAWTRGNDQFYRRA